MMWRKLSDPALAFFVTQDFHYLFKIEGRYYWGMMNEWGDISGSGHGTTEWKTFSGSKLDQDKVEVLDWREP